MLAIVIILAILFLSESKLVKNTFFRCQRSSGAFLSAKRSRGRIICLLPWIIGLKYTNELNASGTWLNNPRKVPNVKTWVVIFQNVICM